MSRSLSGTDRVWLAEKGDERMVLKFIPQEAETDDSGMIEARFSREIYNSCKVVGPEFVLAYPPADGSNFYYRLEYLDAPMLSTVLEARKLTVEETINLGRFLCRAVQKLLSQELIHGDIKPDNILFNNVDFKLLDLGIASPVFTDAADSGTATYLAPERFRGAVVTERTEIYAIGVTLFEALTARAPYGQIERFQKPDFGNAPRPSKFNPNVPPWLDAVVLKCLAVRPAKRFQHYSELMFVLDNPSKAPTDLGLSGPLLETNPLLFYKAGFFIFLASTILLILILCLHH